jgi:spermidine synthase
VNTRLILHLAFFLSGIAGLGCQMIWTRLFANGLGHEMPAVLAVVTAFFGGLALGGWSLNGAIRRSARPARWYAALEIVIGLWAVVSLVVIPWVNIAGARLAGIGAPVTLQWLVTFGLPFLALLPATLAMGATWPAMECFAASVTSGRRVVGGLYAANTLGAVAGVLAGTFVLAPWLGYHRSLLAFAGINFLCAALVWRTEAAAPVNSSAALNGTLKAKSDRSPLGIVFATGLLGIGYEVVGVRVLGRVLENTIYTFAVALAMYLLGAGMGGMIYQRWLRTRNTAALRQWLALAVATACTGGGIVLAWAQPLYEGARLTFSDSMPGGILAEMAVSAAVFLAPSAAMGMLFSHLIQSARAIESSVGRATALNTLGGALAPFVFGVMLIPGAGSKWSLAVVVVGYLALMIPALRRWQAVAAVAPLALLCALPARLQAPAPPPGGRLLDYREGVMDSVAVVGHADGNRSLLANNRFTMGGTGAAPAERRHAHIPLLLHPDPKRALFLGLGTGITFAACGAHPGLQADGVELLPEIIRVLPRFEPENAMPDLGKRLHVHLADARRFVRAAGPDYDVIVADLFHPARDGAGTLYTREHFQAIRRRLAPGGLFCQWLPLYQIDEPVLRVIVKTFLEIFPEGTAWLLRFNVDTPVIGLIGSTGPMPDSATHFASRAQGAPLTAALTAAQLRNDFELFGCRLAGTPELRAYASDAAVNADDRPVVVFEAPRLNYRHPSPPHGRLLALLDRFQSASDSQPADAAAVPVAEGDRFARDLAAFRQARDVYLRGLVDEVEGRSAAAEGKFLESAALSGHFTAGYARCLSMAAQRIKSAPAGARALLERLEKARPDRPVARQLLDRMDAGQ